MRKPAAAAVSVAWGAALGGTFGALLPYLLNDWHLHRPLPYWVVAQVAGALLICAGLAPMRRVVRRVRQGRRHSGAGCVTAAPGGERVLPVRAQSHLRRLSWPC